MQAISCTLMYSWWTFHRTNLFDHVYRWINLIESALWCVFSLLVAYRMLTRDKAAKRSWRKLIETIYSLTFLSFAVTDFQEAFELTTGLIFYKAVNLALLYRLRSMVMSRYYPDSKVY